MLTAVQAYWLAPACIPLALWVALSDMQRMKIPNMASILMIAAWATLGFMAFPLATWGWGWAIMGIALVIGIAGNAISLFGAGDAKFAAAMAGVFVTADPGMLAILVCGAMIGALVTHRIARAIPAVRAATPTWESWTRRDFPFGLALAGTLIFYVSAPILAN